MSDTKEKKIPRHERLFPKLIHLPKERKAEFEAMAKKEDLKLATWIQGNVGNFSKVEEFVRSRVSLIGSKIGKEEISDDEYEAFREMLFFIEELKTKA